MLLIVQIAVSLAFKSDSVPPVVFLTSTGLIVLLSSLFATLSTQVTDKELHWSLGIGLIQKRLSLKDIESVRKVRNKVWWGWGIRYFGEGWLYNVSGLNAIEIVQTDSKVTRVGTDEPDELLQAILQAK